MCVCVFSANAKRSVYGVLPSAPSVAVCRRVSRRVAANDHVHDRRNVHGRGNSGCTDCFAIQFARYFAVSVNRRNEIAVARKARRRSKVAMMSPRSPMNKATTRKRAMDLQRRRVAKTMSRTKAETTETGSVIETVMCANATAAVTDAIDTRTAGAVIAGRGECARNRSPIFVCRSRSPRDRRSSRRSRSRDHHKSSSHHHSSNRRSRSKERSSRHDKSDDKASIKADVVEQSVTEQQPVVEQATEDVEPVVVEQAATTNGGIASAAASE